jgi:hypothetical protein
LKGSQKEGEGDGLDADALSEGQGRVTAAGRGGPRPRDVTGGGLDFRAPFYAPAPRLRRRERGGLRPQNFFGQRPRPGNLWASPPDRRGGRGRAISKSGAG